MAFRITHSAACALCSFLLVAGCATQPPAAGDTADTRTSSATPAPSAEPPRSEFYRTEAEQTILEAARTIIAADRNAGLVTVDEAGRPRIRTVYTSEPDEKMIIWIATRPSTRKVDQIRRNSAVALYYSDDAAAAYVSVMGTATLHDDPATVEAQTVFEPARLREFWPEYPKDFLLLRVEPQWIELTGPGIEAHPGTWRPQAVEFR